jgi:hypothetical protein
MASTVAPQTTANTAAAEDPDADASIPHQELQLYFSHIAGQLET